MAFWETLRATHLLSKGSVRTYHIQIYAGPQSLELATVSEFRIFQILEQRFSTFFHLHGMQKLLKFCGPSKNNY